jgi:ABC-type sugar transport system substrate-binding protein
MPITRPRTRREFIAGTAELAAAGMLFSLTGCQKAPIDTVLYVTLELGNPFYSEMIDGLHKGLGSPAKWRLEVRAGKSADDASGQLDVMQAFLVQHQNKSVKLVGLVVVPAQSGPELTTMIRRYNEAGIPVVNVDIPIDQSALDRNQAHVEAFIGSNNLEGGKAAASVMADKLPKGGDVLVLLGAPGSANARSRRNGFVDRIAEIGRERHIEFRLREWNCNWSASEASTATGTVLAGGKELRGIFAANDEMALGAAQAVGAANLGQRPKPIIVGYDATPDAKKAIKDGRMYASISQNPEIMGQRAIEDLERLVSKQVVPLKEVIPVSPYYGPAN